MVANQMTEEKRKEILDQALEICKEDQQAADYVLKNLESQGKSWIRTLIEKIASRLGYKIADNTLQQLIDSVWNQVKKLFKR